MAQILEGCLRSISLACFEKRLNPFNNFDNSPCKNENLIEFVKLSITVVDFSSVMSEIYCKRRG